MRDQIFCPKALQADVYCGNVSVLEIMFALPADRERAVFFCMHDVVHKALSQMFLDAFVEANDRSFEVQNGCGDCGGCVHIGMAFPFLGSCPRRPQKRICSYAVIAGSTSL